MPYIKEHHLLEFHKNIDKSNAERDEFESHFRSERAKNKKLRSERKLLLRGSAILFVLFIAGIGFYLFKPDLLNSESYLEESDLALVEEGAPSNKGVKIQELNNQKLQSQDLAGKDSESELLELNLNDTGNALSNSLFYAVQVAASKERLFSFLLNESDDLMETIEEGYYKYSYGNFETLTEAQDYRKELLNLGFEDAFVASFKNNKRVKIEEAW